MPSRLATQRKLSTARTFHLSGTPVHTLVHICPVRGLSVKKEKTLNEKDIVPEGGVEKKQYEVIFIISIKQRCSLLIYCGCNCGPKHPSVYKHSLPKASELPNKNKLQPWYVINRKQARVNTAVGTKPGIANTEPQGTDTTQNTSEAHTRAWCEHLLSSKG